MQMSFILLSCILNVKIKLKMASSQTLSFIKTQL